LYGAQDSGMVQQDSGIGQQRYRLLHAAALKIVRRSLQQKTVLWCKKDSIIVQQK